MKLVIGLVCVALIVIFAFIIAKTMKIENKGSPYEGKEKLIRVIFFPLMIVYLYIGVSVIAGLVWCLLWIGITIKECIQWFLEALWTPLVLLVNLL